MGTVDSTLGSIGHVMPRSKRSSSRYSVPVLHRRGMGLTLTIPILLTALYVSQRSNFCTTGYILERFLVQSCRCWFQE